MQGNCRAFCGELDRQIRKSCNVAQATAGAQMENVKGASVVVEEVGVSGVELGSSAKGVYARC